MLEAMAMVKRGMVKDLLITRVDRLGRDAGYADQLVKKDLACCHPRVATTTFKSAPWMAGRLKPPAPRDS